MRAWTRASAAWCSSTAKPESKRSPFWSTVLRDDEWMDRTLSSPLVPLPASRFGTATRGGPPRQPSRGTRRIHNDDAYETRGLDDVDAGVLTTEVTTAVSLRLRHSRPAGWLNRHSSVRGDQHRTEGKVMSHLGTGRLGPGDKDQRINEICVLT